MTDKQKYFYDLEVLPTAFTKTSINQDNKKIIIGLNIDGGYDKKTLQVKLQTSYPHYHIDLRDFSKKENWQFFYQVFLLNKNENDWLGWNSKRYDLPLLCTIFAFISLEKSVPSTKQIRFWSDGIISKTKNIYHYWKWLSQSTDVDKRFSKLTRNYYNYALASQRHIDVSTINEKGGDFSSSRGRMSGALKTVSSFAGLSVLEDEVTRTDFKDPKSVLNQVKLGYLKKNKELTRKGLKNLLIYNIRDVLNTQLLFYKPEYQENLKVKDMIKRDFPYLRISNPHAKNYYKQLPRDATMSQIAGKLIRGKDDIKLKDSPVVKLEYPFPDGHTRDLIGYMKKHEHLVSLVYDFYKHFIGKNTRSKNDTRQLVKSSLTGKQALVVPYMTKKNLSTSAFIGLSIGGAHGSLLSNIAGHEMTPKWVKNFALQHTTIKKSAGVTVDLKNVVHIDFDSFYPTLNIKFGTYKIGKIDPYAKLRRKRLSIKKQIPDDRNVWTKKDNLNWMRQIGLKLVLNGATGASNQHLFFSDLPLDNKILSMRITGNLLIYALGQRFSDQGALIVSSNTDGIYIANIGFEKAKKIGEAFGKEYGLVTEPENIERFVNKSTNERIEFDNGHINKISGNLAQSFTPRGEKSRVDLTHKLNYPRVSGQVVLDYIANNKNWLEEPINDRLLSKSIYKFYNNFQPIDWVVTTVRGHGQNAGNYYLDGKKLQDTNRIIFSKNGGHFIKKVRGKERKLTNFTSNTVKVINRSEELNNLDKSVINLKAYLAWSKELLKPWLQKGMIPELKLFQNQQLDLGLD